MLMKPLDLENQRFHRGFRGYSEEEVDSFLEKVSLDYTQLFHDGQALKEKVQKLEVQLEEYHHLKEALQGSVVLAQKTASERIEQAKNEAQLILDRAKQEAEKIIEEANKRLEQATRELKELENKRTQFQVEFRSLLETHLQLLPGNGHLAQQ